MAVARFDVGASVHRAGRSMTEDQIRKIIRDEIWNEVNREGGLADYMRGAALNMVEPIIELKVRNLREFLTGQITQ